MMYRARLASIAKNLLYRGGAVAVARWLGKHRSVLRVLRYHSVSTNPDYCPRAISVSPQQFEEQISYLKAHYQVIDLDEAIDRHINGEPFPTHSACITFDDGYLDNYEIALPILQRHGLSATFFLTAGPIVHGTPFWVGALQRLMMTCADPVQPLAAIDPQLATDLAHGVCDRQAAIDRLSVAINRSSLSGKADWLNRIDAAFGVGALDRVGGFMMNREQARKLAQAGMTIGAHTVTHPILSSLPDSEALAEMQESRILLEEVIGRAVRHLAYPNGPGVSNFNATTGQLAEKAGFSSASTSRRGIVSADSDRFALPRQGINYKLNQGDFAFKVEEHAFSPMLLNAQ